MTWFLRSPLRHGLMARKSLMRSCNLMTPASSFYYYDPTHTSQQILFYLLLLQVRARLLACWLSITLPCYSLFIHDIVANLLRLARRCHSRPFHYPPTPPIRAEQATSSDGAFHPAIYPATCCLSRALYNIRIMPVRSPSLSRHRLPMTRLVAVRTIPSHFLLSSHPSRAPDPDNSSIYLHLAFRHPPRPTPTPVLFTIMHTLTNILSHPPLAARPTLLRSSAPIVAGHGC